MGLIEIRKVVEMVVQMTMESRGRNDGVQKMRAVARGDRWDDERGREHDDGNNGIRGEADDGGRVKVVEGKVVRKMPVVVMDMVVRMGAREE